MGRQQYTGKSSKEKGSDERSERTSGSEQYGQKPLYRQHRRGSINFGLSDLDNLQLKRECPFTQCSSSQVEM